MRLYVIDRVQRLPISVDRAWRFFSNPLNLGDLTPPMLGLRVIDGGGERLRPGMIITYRLHPFFGLRLSWVTEITHVKESQYFVDEQRFGPYKFWHHQHRFGEVPGGIEMRDIVNYGLPFGPLGRVAHSTVVGRNLHRIFDFRRKVLEDRFGVLRPASPPPDPMVPHAAASR